MCGIFGFAKKGESQNDFQVEKIREMMSNLADNSVVRGKDSTGVAIISPKYNNIWKSTLSSQELLSHSDWDTILGGIDRSATIGLGHVRMATHGEITARNSHPFSMGNVIGAHNGVIYNHDALASDMDIDIEVDSEAIFAAIDKYGVKDAVEKLRGDYALTFVKDNPYKLYLLREDSRPMQYAYWKKARTLFWASTEAILKDSLRKSGLVLKTETLKDEYIFTIDTRKLDKKVSYKSEKFTPIQSWATSGYYQSYGYGSPYKATTYTPPKETKTYKTLPTICPLCNKNTYNDEGICTPCQYDDTIEALCENCGIYKDPLGMTCEEMLLCGECKDSLGKESTAYWEYCDGCGQTFEGKDIKAYGRYSLCEPCDGDADIKSVAERSGYCG